ncbi:hypothetical protein NML43_03415 [Rhodopseudomonas palustris]|uniref:hypothetical protein n=1 Tax=Rhodopseudomonas palustris TaxID=1076 RepID=UPI0020CC738B|nr:hypothetical protein [Rhodopseudomonas palustris]MCP9626135.1 hypothetical protein [Rhodopseudomonas palustris]
MAEEQEFQALVFKVFPELFEHVSNIVNDAQASGSIVQIITIVPPQLAKLDSGGKILSEGCKPGDSICPK